MPIRLSLAMNKRILLLSLLLGGCAYQPNVSVTEQAKPNYQADLSSCQDKQYQLASQMFGPFGILSYAYSESTMTADQVHASQEAITPAGKKKIIDACMTQKGYAVQP